MIQYQILQTNIIRIKWQTIRRITDEILKVVKAFHRNFCGNFLFHYNFFIFLFFIFVEIFYFSCVVKTRSVIHFRDVKEVGIYRAVHSLHLYFGQNIVCYFNLQLFQRVFRNLIANESFTSSYFAHSSAYCMQLYTCIPPKRFP